MVSASYRDIFDETTLTLFIAFSVFHDIGKEVLHQVICYFSSLWWEPTCPPRLTGAAMCQVFGAGRGDKL